MLRSSLLSFCYLLGLAHAATIEDVITTPTWFDKLPKKPIAAGPDPNKFPAKTNDENQKAFPTGNMPDSLEAWPKGPKGRPGFCKVTVLEDAKLGWNANCLGLSALDSAKTSTACQEACEKDSMCSAWQFNDKTGCFVGEGKSCDASRAAFSGTGQRLQHGAVKVLMNTKSPGGTGTKFEVKGLTSIGMFKLPDGKNPTPQVGATHCKHRCYSDIMCEFWQYSELDGCWIDMDADFPTFSDKDWSTARKDWLDKMVDGEFIEHYCPLPPTPPKAVAPPIPTTPLPTPSIPPIQFRKESGPNLTWLWILLGVLGLAAIGAAVYFLTKKKEKEPTKKSRAIKVTPKPKPEPKPVPTPTPVMYSYVQAAPTSYTMPAVRHVVQYY